MSKRPSVQKKRSTSQLKNANEEIDLGLNDLNEEDKFFLI